MLLLSGNNVSAANTDYSNPLVDAAIGAKWSSSIGASNSVIIPKIAFDKIPKASEAVAVLIHALDTTSAVERTGLTQNFFQTITGQFGDGALAFAFVTQNKKEYESSKSVQVNMGLFDTKKMTWKWTTKHGYRQGIVPIPYEIVIRDLVSESFTELTQKNGGKAI